MKMVSEPRTDCKTALRQVCTGRDGGARYSAGVCWYSVRPPAARREAKQGGNTVRSASSLMVDSFSQGRGIVHRDGFLFVLLVMKIHLLGLLPRYFCHTSHCLALTLTILYLP